jgi:hypothetical protein
MLVADGVRATMYGCADSFAMAIRRGAADMVAKLHDDVPPQLRKGFVTLIGNCAEWFKDQITKAVDEFYEAAEKKYREWSG